MEKLSYKLDVFEGPLDLLLHLIKINKVDICDIPIAMLLEQYMEYVDSFSEEEPEIMSDFIDMASTLILIKSRMLLPRVEPEDDPREELVNMLAEYLKYKQSAFELSERGILLNRIFVRKPFPILFDRSYDKSHSADMLAEAFLRSARRLKGKLPPPAESFSPYVTTKTISVASRINYVLRRLFDSGTVKFKRLFKEAASRSEIVAIFLAVLELSKINRIKIGDETDDNVTIELRGGAMEVTDFGD